MTVYQFALCFASSREVLPNEHLGFIALGNDDEAFAFVGPIVEDLARAGGIYQGSAIEISADKRLVGSIPVEAGEQERLRA